MARRFRYGRSRTSGSPRPPAAPKAPKMQRPNYKALLAAYKKYLSGSAQVRTQALFETINWWDQAVNYFLSRKPMDSSQLSTYEKANKARALGVGGTTDNERETGLLTAVRMYEKIWADDNKVPKIGPYVDRFKAQQSKLVAKEQQLQARFVEIMQGLNSTFSPLGLAFTVQKSDVPREFDGIKTILLSQELCKVLSEKARSEGLLSVLFSEAVTAIKAAAVEADDQGRHTLNVMKITQLLPQLFSSILKYCDSVPRAKVFKSAPETIEAVVGATVPKTHKVKVPRDPNAPKRTFGGAHAGPRVGGRYTPGSAMALLYERLQDQQVKQLKDVLSGIAAANPADRLKWLVKHGKETGKWTVTTSGSTVQMILH